MWNDITAGRVLVSAYQGPTISLRDLYGAIQSRGWEVTNVKWKTDGWEAEAKSADGRKITKAAPTQASAVQHLLLAVTHADYMRVQASRAKLGMWSTTFTHKLQPIADAYAKAPAYDPKAVEAFMELAHDAQRRLETLRGQMHVEVVDDPEPYISVEEMCEDITKHKHLAVSRANADHPLWSPDQLVAFRAVHDVLGYCAGGAADFGWAGENQACAAHFPLLSEPAQKALFTQCIAQMAYALAYRGHGPEKLCLLDDEIEHAMAKENKGGHQGIHPSQALAPTETPEVPRLATRTSKRFKATHANPAGEPCGCPWNRDTLTKEASKLQWLQERPDVKTDLRKNLIVNQLFPHYGPDSDPALPWVLREYKKGRLQMPDWWNAQVTEYAKTEQELADFVQSGGDRDSPEGDNLAWQVRQQRALLEGRTRASDLLLDGKPIQYVVRHIGPMLDDLARRRQGIDLMQQDAPTFLSRVHEWHEEQEEKRREEERQRLAGQIVHKFPDGWTVRRLRTAEEAALEGDQMGHCVGSYGHEIEDGNTNIFSLRDEKNEPHATTEVRARSGRLNQWYVPGHVWDELPMKKFKGVPIEELRAHHDRVHAGDQYDDDPVYDEFMEKAVEHGSAMPALHGGDVVQTQGKSNQVPLDEYTNRLDDFLRPHDLQTDTFTPWWDDWYGMDGPATFRELVGYNHDDHKFGLRGYPQDDWYEKEPEDYRMACSDAEEHGLEEPELHIGEPNYHQILEDLVDPEAESYYDHERGAYRIEKPWHGYNPEAGQYVVDHAMAANQHGDLRHAFGNHLSDAARIEPFVAPRELDDIPDQFERERAMRNAEQEHYEEWLSPDWMQMVNHLGPKLVQNFTPIGPQAQQFEVHPEQQQLFRPGVFSALHKNAGLIDPNHGWDSGIEPLVAVNGQSLREMENDPLGIHRPNSSAVTATDMAHNLARIDQEDPGKRWWDLQHPDGSPARDEMKKAIVNAFSAVLLSPKTNLQWNTIHYQHLADIVHTTEDPDYLHKRLEQRRLEWNRARKISPLAHKPYYREQQDLARWLKSKDPALTDELAHMEAAAQVRRLLEQEKARLADELQEAESGRPPEKRTTISQIEIKAGNEVVRILRDIVAPAHNPATDFSDQTPLFALEHAAALHPPSQMSIAAPKDVVMDPSIVQMFDGSVNPEAMGAYGAWMGDHLKSIAQVSRHADAILDVALRELQEHDGGGHSFRAYVLSLGIPGIGPKVTSFAWLLLAPELSQLATIDSHMLEVLGRHLDEHPSPRDYFKLEREFRARLDAAGYQSLPLGLGQWAMWDYKRGGPDSHQDHSGLRPLNFVHHDHIDWEAKTPKGRGTRWKAPDWWQQTEGIGKQVGDHFDQTIGTNFRRDEIPFQDNPHYVLAASADEFHVSWAVPADIQIKLANWIATLEWPSDYKLDEPGQYHITVAYAHGGWKDTDQHALVRQFTSTDLPFDTAGLELFGPDKDTVVLRLTSEVGSKWANRIMGALEANGLTVERYDGYKPHITLGTASALPKGRDIDFTFRAGNLYISKPRALSEKEAAHPIFSVLSDRSPAVTHPDGESDVGAPGETIMQYLRGQLGLSTEEAWQFPGAVTKIGP